VQVPLELSGEGSVLIASSSGLERAHESEGLLGSYFTHHFVAGLRGAADPRGDGIVTVTDAFAYAKERTVRDTAAVASEPQHPSFFSHQALWGERLPVSDRRPGDVSHRRGARAAHRGEGCLCHVGGPRHVVYERYLGPIEPEIQLERVR
jgi:hypothetical protein